MDQKNKDTFYAVNISNLFWDPLEQTYHGSGQYTKTEYTKKIITISFSFLPK